MLSPWKESYDQPRQHIQKQRHYFANNGHLVKAMVFPVVMYGCESWTIKKAEHRRIDAFIYLFLKYKFIYFNWRLITLQYLPGATTGDPTHDKGHVERT